MIPAGAVSAEAGISLLVLPLSGARPPFERAGRLPDAPDALASSLRPALGFLRCLRPASLLQAPLEGVIRSITFPRGARGGAMVTSLPSAFSLTGRGQPPTYSSSYFFDRTPRPPAL